MNSTEKEALTTLMAAHPRMSWRESTIEAIIRMGLHTTDQIEMRITNTESRDPFKQVQRAADTFLTVYTLYPTSIAVHSTVARLLEVSEVTITAKHRLGPIAAPLLGAGFEAVPLRIECDDSLDTSTVAVRFSLDMESYGEALMAVLVRNLEKL